MRKPFLRPNAVQKKDTILPPHIKYLLKKIYFYNSTLMHISLPIMYPLLTYIGTRNYLMKRHNTTS